MSKSLEQGKQVEVGLELDYMYSLGLPGNRYLFILDQDKLNAGIYEAKPFTGTYQFRNQADWDKLSFRPLEEDSHLLKGTVSRDKFNSFATRLESGGFNLKGSTKPIKTQLLELLQPAKLTAKDFDMTPRKQILHRSVAPGKLTENIPVIQIQDVFDIHPSSDAVLAIEEAVRKGDAGLVLIDKKNIDRDNVWYMAKGGIVPLAIDPLCKQVVDPSEMHETSRVIDISKVRAIDVWQKIRRYRRRESPEKEEHYFTESEIIYILKIINPLFKLARNVAFDLFEGRGPGKQHRFLSEDTQKLRLFLPSQKILNLDAQIAISRFASFIGDKAFGALSEFLLASAVLFEADGASVNTLKMVGYFGIIFSRFIGREVQGYDDSEFRNSLGKLLDEMAGEFPTEAEIYSAKSSGKHSLQLILRELSNKLTDAEKFPPPISEVLPSFLALEGATILHGVIQILSNWPDLEAIINSSREDMIRAAGLAALFVVSQLIMQQALAVSESQTISEVRKFTQHFSASIVERWPALLTIGTILSAVLPKDIMIFGLFAEHIAEEGRGLEAVDAGTKARTQLHKILDSLSYITLTTDELRFLHSATILLEEGQLETRVENGYTRYILLDQVHDQEQSLSVLFHDYEIGFLPEKHLVQDSSLAISSGSVNFLVIGREQGLTTVLHTLADDINHPKGKALLRLPDGSDRNLHEDPEERRLFYFNCDGRDKNYNFFYGVPFDDIYDYLADYYASRVDSSVSVDQNAQGVVFNRSDLIKTYLKTTDMFTDEEIEIFFSEDIILLSSFDQFRIKVAEALVRSENVIILDDVFSLDLAVDKEYLQECEKVWEFIAREAAKGEKIILIGSHWESLVPKDLFKRLNVLGKIYTVDNESKKFVEAAS